MRFASVTAAVVLIGACARAETGPCKPDQFPGLTCGEGPGAARVIEGTISPDNLQVESVILQLHDGRPLAISPGNYWDTGGMHANRYDFHAIWSPNSRFVVELLDFRWGT